MFYARTGDSELTFSKMLDWEDPLVYGALIGFSLAASDAVLCVKRTRSHNRERYRDAVRTSMHDILSSICPPADRKIEFGEQQGQANE
ncbi:uncharacterized protein PHACADRAFT_251190 [Phanerochaete carnosa HHB-10118-sp]|uniref:Uncharacterized protein n=1 Tax=Phanerochaete carnosa (strain HHB-10118-sp) TaxID=650164 RepID=K5V4H6_PHACS|nr:uncharacterized protein PHACADRAFT_251190 [Phanerochaete carnosa HHB-10118-sp]EKM57516.1 hypothetical protein PHACADRAFT_251190 [Phanerochaete carnosa HHB-10118-sp]